MPVDAPVIRTALSLRSEIMGRSRKAREKRERAGAALRSDCTQIGSTTTPVGAALRAASPPAAPGGAVTTPVRRRGALAFILAEAAVPAMPIFVPGLAARIPRRFP